MSCQQVPTTPAFNPYPRSVQVGEFEVAIDGGIWVAIRDPFRVIKRQFGHVKVRYRGLMKNTAQLHTLFALSNLWMARHRLLQRAQG